MVFVCACVFCECTIYFFARGGAFNMSRPRGPWFLNPSMYVHSRLTVGCFVTPVEKDRDAERGLDIYFSGPIYWLLQANTTFFFTLSNLCHFSCH